MNKHIIGVPAGIRYISEWEEFRLFDFPYIIDKQITGCGFTEWAIRSPINLILVSPRVGLLDNKYEQYLERVRNGELDPNKDYKVYYAKNRWEGILEIDKNINVDYRRNIEKIEKLEKERFEKEKEAALEYKNLVKAFWKSCQEDPFLVQESVPCKILVTYDSFRKVKEALIEEGVFDQFHVVIDEFQSIFVDSRFKATSELEFVSHLQGVQKVCYVSATPMIDKYLDQLDEFKDLPFLNLDWGINDRTRITRPTIRPHSCTNMVPKVVEIINK